MIKKIKIIILSLFITILFGCILTSNSYATMNYNINLSASKDAVKPKEEFSVSVAITNLETTKGIIVIGGELEYDTTSLTLTSMKGANGWSNPSYNEEHGKFTALSNEVVTTDQTVLTLTFTVKEDAKDTAWIKIKNFEVSDGYEEKNIEEKSLTITLQTASQNDNIEENLEDSNSQNNNQVENNDKDNSSENNGNIDESNRKKDSDLYNNSKNENNNVNHNSKTENSNLNNNIENNNQIEKNNQNKKIENNKESTNQDTSVKNEIIPQLGEKNSTILFIVIAIIFTLIFGIRILLLNKKINNK